MYEPAVSPKLFAVSLIPIGIKESLFANIEYILLVDMGKIIFYPFGNCFYGDFYLIIVKNL